MSLIPGPNGLPQAPGLGDPMAAMQEPLATPTAPEMPLDQRLAYGSEFHGSVLSRLNARVDLSRRHISTRYDDWDRTDEHCRMYIDLSRKARKGDRTEDPTKREMPFDRSIAVPMSMAVLLVRLTQLMAIFTSRQPLIQLEGRGPEDVRPAKLMEAVLAYDLNETVAPLVFYALFQDAEKYGMGVVFDTWESEQGWIYPPAPRMPDMITKLLRAMGVDLTPPRQWGITREYNRWEPVDPYNFWPDPRVPVSQIQKGEFVGHRVYVGANNLKSRAAPAGPYFNLDHLKDLKGGAATGRLGAGMVSPSRDRFATEEFALRSAASEEDAGFFRVDHLQVDLIAADWKLGPETRPEKWWFTIIDETLIIRAHPCAYAHGQFSYSVGESIPDEHALSNPGMIESLDGLQRFMNWLLNSHLTNVIRHLNDAMIYSPSLIEEADLLNPGPARHIRLTQKGMEMVENGQLTAAAAISQLPLIDVTAPHLKTINVLFDMAQRLAATSDPQMSQPTDDQRTLGEVQQIIAASSQRLALVAKLLDASAISPLAKRAVANRQQFTSLDQFFRIAGDLAKELGGMDRMSIGPQDIAGSFDYVPHSGALPPDPTRTAAIWMRILEGAAKIPQLSVPQDGKVLDIREVFNEAAKQAGAKNIEQFYRDVPVMPNPMVDAAVQAGNMIPAAGVPPTGPIPGAGIQTPVVPGANIR